MQTNVYTYSDVQSHLADWSGSATADQTNLRKIKTAVESAYRDIANCRRWGYLMGRGSLQTVASYATGTIAYTNSTRAVTLTGGTFPSWSAFGIMQINGVEYPIISLDSSTQVTLSINNNPGSDVAAGASFRLWRDTYPLPVNFVEIGTIKDASKNITLEWVEPNDFVAMRLFNTATALPHYYTITSDPHYIGTMAIRLYPAPDAVYTYGYMYHRRPRPFTQAIPYNTGTITSSGTTLTGTSTAWTSQMLGCTVRSGTAQAIPTGTIGANPYQYQRVITAYTSGTLVGMDVAFDSDIASAVKYEISDPIDVESGAMYSAFLRKCELELGTLMRRNDIQLLQANYYSALNEAMEADNRSFDRKPEGTRYWRRVPLYFPIQNATG